MKKKVEFKYFIVFIFLAILFYINTNTVFAAKTGGGSGGHSGTTTFKRAEDFQSTSEGTYACKIYTSSNYIHPEQRQFNLGWKADIFANTEAFYSNTAKAGKVAWTSFTNLIAYPRIILFEEKWRDYSTGRDNYKRSIGYLYLYVDSYEAREAAAVWASYANTDEEPVVV